MEAPGIEDGAVVPSESEDFDDFGQNQGVVEPEEGRPCELPCPLVLSRCSSVVAWIEEALSLVDGGDLQGVRRVLERMREEMVER